LPTFFHSLLFPDIPFPRSRTWFATPIPDQSSDFFNPQSSPTAMNTRIFVIACLSSSLTGDYHRLYASSSDGLSFNRLQNAVQGYGGPTLLLIRSTSGGIFGAFTASTWKESKDFYGNTDCFLLQLSPRTAVYRPTANERNFMYCNSAARSKGYDQQAHGIGFGGSVQEPRLFLPESFEDCVASSQDLTFENGRLLPDLDDAGGQQSKKYFDIDSLEVWGVGGSDVVQAAFQARDASRAITDEAIRRARKVDKAQFLDDFRAGTFESKAFQHQQQIDGRADCDVQDRNHDKDKVYDYAK
jgi:TLD